MTQRLPVKKFLLLDDSKRVVCIRSRQECNYWGQ
jgi:hypothetical protein